MRPAFAAYSLISIWSANAAGRDLEGARTDVTEARPGDEITIETVLRPYRGELILQQIPIHIPTSTSKGPLRILVSDGETLDRVRRAMPALGRKMDLASTIAMLNKQHVNNRVYVSLLEADPEATVADKVMPTLPTLHHERDGRHAGHPGNGRAGRVFGKRSCHRPAGLCGGGRAGADDHGQVSLRLSNPTIAILKRGVIPQLGFSPVEGSCVHLISFRAQSGTLHARAFAA